MSAAGTFRTSGDVRCQVASNGGIAEEIIKSVLGRTLPKRFSIGTGVVISAHGEVSRQTDIVIYDNFYNSPLLSEFGSGLFPAEIVFATIEVKSVLTKNELQRSMDAIMQMRKVGSQKKYIVPATVFEPGKLARTVMTK